MFGIERLFRSTEPFAAPSAFDLSYGSGPTLLITGGMDGDEYAGMDAARALAAKYAQGGFRGRLIVVPVVNVAGFEHASSFHPSDGLYPKRVFPGKEGGSPTQRLMHWLASTYAYSADAWLDFHGGNLEESVQPFIWAHETGAADVDALTLRFCAVAGVPAVLDAHNPVAADLAARGVMYALTEAGGRGRREPEDIARHVAWAERLMQLLGMLDGAPSEDPQPLLRKVAYASAPHDGIFHPERLGAAVQEGERIGRCTRANGTGMREALAPLTGLVLWRKEGASMRKGDVLCAIGAE